MKLPINLRLAVVRDFQLPIDLRIEPIGNDSANFVTRAYDIEIVGSKAMVAQIVDVTDGKHPPWLIPGFRAIRVRQMFTLDLSLDEVPKGTMFSTYKKGVEAFVTGLGPDSYPGDAGTGVHTVWLKGWFRSWVGQRLADAQITDHV